MTESNERVDLVIVSFGYGHGPAPESDFVFDVRRFRDPIHGVVREYTGLDPRIRDKVLNTPSVRDYVDHISAFVVGLNDAVWPDTWEGTITVAFGCNGGRHRSVAIAEKLGEIMGSTGSGYGWTVKVEHRDIGKPVLARVDPPKLG